MRVIALLVACVVATPALAAEYAVEIKGMKFSPATLEVAVGDTITFTNRDSAPHTATALDASFDTGRLNKGRKATVTIKAAGQHAFKCQIHPMMTGTVVAE